MDKITTEEVISKIDMFQYKFWKKIQIWLVGFRRNFSRYRYAIYLHRVQVIMPNLQCLFDSSGSGTSGNERTGRSDMENVTYNFILTYGTCDNF